MKGYNGVCFRFIGKDEVRGFNVKELNNDKGVIFISSFMIIVLILAFAGIVFPRVHNTIKIYRNLANDERSESFAYRGRDRGAEKLSEELGVSLNDEINDLSETELNEKARLYINGDSNQIGFLNDLIGENASNGTFTYDSSRKFLSYTLVASLDQDGNAYVAGVTNNKTVYNPKGIIEEGYTIRIWEKPETEGQELTSTSWEFEYEYEIKGEGRFASTSDKVKLGGDFVLGVVKGTFSQYAMFIHKFGNTNQFTTGDVFRGAVHTNQRFRFKGTPEFYGEVTQRSSKAKFFNGSTYIKLDEDSYPPTTVPIFHKGFKLGVDKIKLPKDSVKDDLIQQAAGSTAYTEDGIYLTNTSNTLTQGIYVKGDSTIELTVDSSDRAVYEIFSGTSHQKITVDVNNNQTLVEDVNSSTTTTYAGLPDGEGNKGTIIYVEGKITDIGGTLQQDTQATIVSSNNIVIQDHIYYEGYTAGIGTFGDADYVPPNADGIKSTLGLISFGGDVSIGTDAPNDVNIHATVMAVEGEFKVDDNHIGSDRGTAMIMGGITQKEYGEFNDYDANGNSGYTPNFAYDTRMETNSPPYYPILPTFRTEAKNLFDKMTHY